MTTHHLLISLKKLRAFHVQRALQFRQTPQLRDFHRTQAKILRQKINEQKNAPWNWEKFLEAYKGK
jgi:hypothetical protein